MSKYYYNGVLLPEIPSDILSEYPNVFLYKWVDGGDINFMAAPANNKWYYDSTYQQIRISECSYKRYKYNADTDAWELRANHTDNGRWGTQSDVGSVVWTNNTIPSGSVDSTTSWMNKCYVYEPVTEKLDYNGVMLPPIPTEHIATNPYIWIRQNGSTGYYDLVMGAGCWYYNNALYCTSSATLYWYRIPIENVESATEWTFYKETTGSFGIDGSRPVLWSLQDVSNSINSTSVYFAGTDLVVDYLTKYLVRDNGKIYTVADDALVEVSGEINADMFKTNGIDTIPDGSLLMTLSNPEVLCWTDAEKLPTLTATVKGIPEPQIVMSKEIDLMHSSIKGINGVTVDCKGDVLFAISFDKKATWMMHNGTEFVEVYDKLAGMTKTEFEAITTEQWQPKYEASSDMYIRCTILDETQSITTLNIDFIN